MATFSLERPKLPVLLPSIRPVLSPGVIGTIVAWLWQVGVRLIAYIDDFLLGESLHTNSTHDHGTASIGFLDEQREIHPNTLSGNRILRSDSSILPLQFFVYANTNCKYQIQGPAVNTQGCLSPDHYSKGLKPNVLGQPVLQQW